ncbi:DUF7178 family protein [Streptomyces fulvoviolaceus]|uniref:DUF7178 family protein n=1 Tax=Streptomyces fulvoviolaceus TaxID=285535 RepID=UPI0021C1A3CC|nr:hypothetical protein [Streptomyces fulvoviolaceus]MCT9080483.1 hypothetical protein [Streptomyces fulvoviolaceus]
MISVKASEETRERYVRNIIATWRAASPEQIQRGRTWYCTAHDLASRITKGDARAGAGVLAALSANKSWSENCRLAHQAYETGVPSGHFRDALSKVAKIMAGEDPEGVLPMERKTGMFFRCIADPSDPDAVVIDRHAHDVAVGETYGQRDRGLGSTRRYALLAHCYREAARRLGELPSTVQSVTWVVHTERIAGSGTRGPRR